MNKISGPEDLVYIWGGGTAAWLYYDLDRKLPSRYVSFVHTDNISGSEKETLESLKKSAPKFIITTPRQTPRELASLIEENYIQKEIIDDVIVYELR